MMSNALTIFNWSLSFIFAILATLAFRSSRVWGIVFGLILSEVVMGIGVYLLKISFGAQVNFEGTNAYVEVNILLLLIGALLGAYFGRLLRKEKG
jgi:hypothetical protein